MEKLSKAEKFNLALAFTAIVLSMAAIISFIYLRNGVIFYLLILLALGAGFYMTYFISKSEKVPRKKRKG